MKYLKALLFSILLVVSSGSDSDILGIPFPRNPLDIYRELKEALAKVKQLTTEKEKLEADLNQAKVELNSAKYQIIFLTGVTKKQIEENGELKRELNEAKKSTISRLQKFWSMYETGTPESLKSSQ